MKAFLLVFAAVWLTGVFLFFLFQLVTFPFYVYAFLRGAFYAPTPKQKTAKMIALIKHYVGKKNLSNMYAADLGSGDGRIVVMLAQQGFHAHGYEINPVLVLQSRWNVWRSSKKHPTQHPPQIFLSDFWQRDFSQYSVVTVYGIPHIMKKLEKKLLAELPKGAIVVSNAFSFPNWKPIKEEEGVFVYKKPPARRPRFF
jgi:hypothetical protein